MKREVLDNFLNTLGNVSEVLVKKTSAAADKVRRDYEQQETQRRQADALALYYQNGVCISRDLAYILQSVSTSIPLCGISDYRNLDFMPEFSQNLKIFAFCWRKKVRDYAVTAGECQNLIDEINRKIEQFPFQLRLLNYDNLMFASGFPALYQGFRVINIVDADNGLLIYVLADC